MISKLDQYVELCNYVIEIFSCKINNSINVLFVALRFNCTHNCNNITQNKLKTDQQINYQYSLKQENVTQEITSYT